MKEITTKEIELSPEEVEKIIKKHLIKKNVISKGQKIKIDFKVKDVGIDDNDTMPYCANYKLTSIEVKAK